MGAYIAGIGVEYPENILHNSDIEKIVETTDEWIQSRTGIRERRILPKGSTLKASDLGAAAALKAMSAAGIIADQVDAIICGSVVPDKQFPATACFIQEKIGAKNAFAYDVTAACAGFVFGVNQASLLIDSGQCKTVLVIGAETLSKAVNWTDRNTCILFGDAAGAAVMRKGNPGHGVLQSLLRSDGAHADILYLDLLGGTDATMKMDGKQVFKLAVSEVSRVVVDSLAAANLKPSDLDLLVIHQANARILNAIAEKLGLPPEKVPSNVHRFGNTSSASIPLALHDSISEGKLKPGMLVCLAAVGGGMSWGCNLIRW